METSQQPAPPPEAPTPAPDSTTAQGKASRADTTVKHPDLSKPPAAAGESRPSPLYVDPNEFARIQDEMRQLREFKAEREREAEARDAELIRQSKDAEQLKEALAKREEKYRKEKDELLARLRERDEKWLDERKTTEINRVLTGRKFAGVDPSVTAAHVRAFLEREVEAVMGDGGVPIVRDRVTLRPAAEYLSERLSSPEFALYFQAEQRGGAGADGTRPAAATPKSPDDRYEAFAADFRDRMKAAREGRYLSQNTRK